MRYAAEERSESIIRSQEMMGRGPERPAEMEELLHVKEEKWQRMDNYARLVVGLSVRLRSEMESEGIKIPFIL